MVFGFRVTAVCSTSAARTGVIDTAHGSLETPAFMPVGTQATVKALSPEELAAAGAGCILANTYHLALRPGADLIQRMGGLHAFMAWSGPILTDSGGFQVMSLGALRELSDEGVAFRSHLDDTPHFFSPERVVHLQAQLGSDIAMLLDQCAAYPCSREEASLAVQRTHTWAVRSRPVCRPSQQALFAIVQGNTYADLRRQSARNLAALNFPGYAIGGLSVGEPRALTRAMLETSLEWLPPDRPRYLMGVGAPDDLVELVGYGVDMFDCVLPTRLGRNGTVFTSGGRLSLHRTEAAAMSGPIDATCSCYACTHHSRAYLHHLFRAHEPLGYRLASLHNVTFLLALMAQLRTAIRNRNYPTLRARLLEQFGGRAGARASRPPGCGPQAPLPDNPHPLTRSLSKSAFGPTAQQGGV